MTEKGSLPRKYFLSRPILKRPETMYHYDKRNPNVLRNWRNYRAEVFSRNRNKNIYEMRSEARWVGNYLEEM